MGVDRQQEKVGDVKCSTAAFCRCLGVMERKLTSCSFNAISFYLSIADMLAKEGL